MSRRPSWSAVREAWLASHPACEQANEASSLRLDPGARGGPPVAVPRRRAVPARAYVEDDMPRPPRTLGALLSAETCTPGVRTDEGSAPAVASTPAHRRSSAVLHAGRSA